MKALSRSWECHLDKKNQIPSALRLTMDKPASYAIVEGTTIQELMDEVNSWMRRGWTPLGGVCSGLGAVLLQAMVQYQSA